jgi:hypothetical protein
MKSSVRTIGSLFVGFYAWAAAVSFGLALLDIVYSRLLPGSTAAFSEVADFLLLVTTVTVLAALTAITLAWNSAAARNFLLASLAVAVYGLFAPLLLSPFLPEGSPVGAAIRILIGATVSLLALVGLYKYSRRG